jgi:UDP-N-acetylmuramyl pentapeptide synthase
VLELGMYHTGEIKEMVDFLKPNIAIITTIAATHLANFKNIYGIADAKAEIYYNLSDEKLAIIPDGEFNDYLTKIAQNYTKNIYKISDFVTINDYFFDYNCNQTHIKLSLKQHKFIFFISALGKQYVENIKNIVATLDGLQLDITIGLNALKNYNVIEGRGNELRLKINNKQVILIDESYNSSPKSLENAIYNLTEIYKTKRKILIISDMLELGKDEILLHQEISKYPNFNQIEMVITVGKLMEHLHQEISNIFHFNDYKELINDGFKFVQEDDVILLKGSNSTNIKKVVQFLKEKSVE